MIALAHPYILSQELPLPPRLLLMLEKGGGDFYSLESIASPSLSPYGGPRLDLFRGHAGAPIEPHEPGVHDGGRARNLRVPEDAASAMLAEGYVVAFAVCCEWGFSVPSHQFLRSLL
jgi:hypothetical protein